MLLLKNALLSVSLQHQRRDTEDVSLLVAPQYCDAKFTLNSTVDRCKFMENRLGFVCLKLCNKSIRHLLAPRNCDWFAGNQFKGVGLAHSEVE